MKTTRYWLFCMLPIIMLCAPIAWEPIQKISENTNEKRMPTLHHCPTTGITHIFWEQLNPAKDLYLFYRARYQNNTFSPIKQLDMNHPLAFYENQISVQSTPDCSKIFVAYAAYRVQSNKGCTVWNKNSCLEVFFIETENHGVTWSEPVKIKRENFDDETHRTLPSMVYEKESGKLFIAYYIDMNGGYIYRDKEQKNFTEEKRLSLYMFGRILHMGYTHDANSNKKYLQVVWWEDDLERTKSIYYARSEDEGENWTHRMELVKRYKSENLPDLAIDTNAAAGSIYVQYSDKDSIYIMWSKDHGFTWEKNITVGRAFTEYNAITICGLKGKGKVFSMAPGFAMTAGFLKSMDAGQQSTLVDLGYPYTHVKEMKWPNMHCGYSENGDLTIVATLVDQKESEILLARGKIKANTFINTQ